MIFRKKGELDFLCYILHQEDEFKEESTECRRCINWRQEGRVAVQ